MIAARGKKGFFGYDTELEEAIFDFQRNEYPERDPEQNERNWRWMFLDSAAGLDREPSVWLYCKNDAVVAHQGAIPVRLHIGDEVISSGWFVETMAAASVRGSPIGPMLIKKALEDMPLNLSLGQTEQMRKLQFAMGWQYVCSLTKYVFVCGYRMDLRKKLPMIVAEFAAAVLGVRHNLHWRRNLSKRNTRFRFQRIDRFASEHDELWARMAPTATCAVVRDSSYMNWKYIDRPSSSFDCIEMRDGHDLVGVVVVMLANANETYSYTRGCLIDFVVPLDRQDLLSALIAEGIGVLKSLGAQTIVCQSSGPGVCAALERFGFSARQPRHQFLVAPGAACGLVAQRLLESDNWFLTMGDSDADAYVD